MTVTIVFRDVEVGEGSEGAALMALTTHFGLRRQVLMPLDGSSGGRSLLDIHALKAAVAQIHADGVAHAQHFDTWAKLNDFLQSKGESGLRAIHASFSLAQWCQQEQAEGNGRCGACAGCVKVEQDKIALLESALPDSQTAGPDGNGYKYAWDELTNDEQEWLKDLRRRVHP